MERVIDSVDIHKLLGAINGLVEQRGYKVVVIANNSYLQQRGQNKLVFKEKVIEKTLIYEPDVVTIYKEICNNNYQPPFCEFMLDAKAVSVIDPVFPSYKENVDLQVNLRNIRIIKFALAHFYKIYKVCEDFLKDEDKSITNEFLLSLWSSTVGIAIEYKRNRLSYKEHELFANYVDVSSIDWHFNGENEEEALFNEENADDTEKKNEAKEQKMLAKGRISRIFQKIVKVHDLPIIVCPQVFEFVTAGISPDKEGMRIIWERYKEQVQRNSISPAYSLLQHFLQTPWKMSNKEMSEALIQLAQFVEDGAYKDNMSYVNAATYLQHLRELTPLTQKDVKEKTIKGIDKMYDKITSLSILDKMNLDVVESEIPNESRWVVEYERYKMEEITSANMNADIREVCRLFNEDLPALAERLTVQYNSTEVPEFTSYPILKHIAPKDIIKKVNEISPQEVIALYKILNTRFLQMVSPKVYDVELSFMKNLILALEQRKQNKKNNREYSDILIEDYLEKLLKKINYNNIHEV